MLQKPMALGFNERCTPRLPLSPKRMPLNQHFHTLSQLLPPTTTFNSHTIPIGLVSILFILILLGTILSTSYIQQSTHTKILYFLIRKSRNTESPLTQNPRKLIKGYLTPKLPHLLIALLTNMGISQHTQRTQHTLSFIHRRNVSQTSTIMLIPNRPPIQLRVCNQTKPMAHQINFLILRRECPQTSHSHLVYKNNI